MPYIYAEKRCTVYHSCAWEQMLALGWITMSVDNGVATMIRQWGHGEILK